MRRRPDDGGMSRRRSSRPRVVLLAALLAALGLAVLAVPVLQGWREGPRFPVPSPSIWEVLRQFGRDLHFR